jgi:hypothetical protein
MPTIPAVEISKVLLPQSNIMAAFVHSHSNLLFDVCPVLPTYSNHNVTHFTVYSIWPLAGNLSILLPWLHKKYTCCYNYNRYTHLEVQLFVICSDTPLKIKMSVYIRRYILRRIREESYKDTVTVCHFIYLWLWIVCSSCYGEEIKRNVDMIWEIWVFTKELFGLRVMQK